MMVEKIGQGSFGKVYLAKDILNQNQLVAIKTESINQPSPQLLKEVQSFKALQGGPGIPKLLAEGISVDNNVIYMVMELMGPSLKDLFTFCNRRFTLKTTLMIFYQLIDRVEFIHSKNYIHRDLKPDNIMMGLGKKSCMPHLIDFGLTRSIIDPKTNQHIPFVAVKQMFGTCRYMSVTAH